MGYELVSRSARSIAGSLLGLGLLAAPCAATLAAEVTVGAGLRTSFTVSDFDGGDESSDFALNSARIYLGGTVTDEIGFMFNTEYNGEEMYVLDAAAKFTFSDGFNLMAGRFLAPSDRANLYGPYYGNNWGFATDGVQDGYPFVVGGRSDGAMYWGQYGITKLALGVFDNELQGLTGGDLKYAGRAQFDFWDSEDGYYLNGSYYGAKNLLALGVAVQGASGESAYTVDALLEKKVASGGVVTLEAEYAKYDGFGYYPGFTDGDGYYVLAAYLFPQVVGIGKFQVLAKYGTAEIDGDDGEGGDTSTDVDTLELNLNYIIKDQAARVHLFYIDSDGSAKVYGLGLQIQM